MIGTETAQSQAADRANAIWDAYRVGECFVECARRLRASPATEPQEFLSPVQAHAVSRLMAVLERVEHLAADPELLSAMARLRYLAFEADTAADGELDRIAETGEP